MIEEKKEIIRKSTQNAFKYLNDWNLEESSDLFYVASDNRSNVGEWELL